MFLSWNGYLVVGIAWSMNIIAWGKLHVNRIVVPVCTIIDANMRSVILDVFLE